MKNKLCQTKKLKKICESNLFITIIPKLIIYYNTYIHAYSKLLKIARFLLYLSKFRNKLLFQS